MITRRYAWYILGLLTAINFINYVDRLVIVTLFDDLRVRFAFSDAQLGAFWLAFFVVHAIATFPLGWASDHFDRRKIIGIGVIVWSLATLGSAWAWGFFSMLVLRAMIGIGEAAYNPPANALLCEVFPERKARAVAVYNLGMLLGGAAGLAAGGLLGFPRAFQVVAIPGLVLGVLAMVMKVPPERTENKVRPQMRTMLRDGWRTMKIPTMRWTVLSGIFVSLAAGGYIVWIVDFTTRYKGMTIEQATTVYSIIVMSAGLGGVLLGGIIADWWHKRSLRGRPLTVSVGFLFAFPFSLLIVYFDRGWPFFVSGWFMLFFLSFYNGPIAAVIDDVVDDETAGTAQATYVFFIHVLGTGPGGFLIGAVSGMTSLRAAFLVPAAAVGLAGICSYLASRHVTSDIRKRNERAAASAAVVPAAASA